MAVVTDAVSKLSKLVSFQLDNLFMTEYSDHKSVLFGDAVREAVVNAERCFGNMKIGGGEGGNRIDINPFHANTYSVFLYWMSRYLSVHGELETADKIYYLNKSLNCVELYHEVVLPSIWFCEHPLGSVMGRAKYGDYFFFYQGCTVGGNFQHDGSIVYPEIGSHVKMLSNSKILGKCHIGNHVVISANAYVKDCDVPDNVIVFGTSPDLVFKPNYFKEGCSKENILTR